MKWKQRCKYWFDQFVSKGTLSLVLMLSLVTLTSVVLIGIIAFWVKGENISVLHSIWVSFMQTLDSGNLSNAEGSFFYMLLMTVSTIVGIFITSMLISIISTGFQEKLEHLRKGTSQIMEKHHTLILGWNDSVPVIVAELIESNRNVKHPVIVILGTDEMTTIQTALKQSVPSFYNSKVIIRTGAIDDKASLEMCAIGEAKSVIISDTDDVKSIKTLLAIKQTCFFQNNPTSHITAIFSDARNVKIAEAICGGQLEAIHLADAMDRIMAQTCLQPGLSFVYKELFDFSGDEIYFFQHEKLVGKSVKEIVNLFDKSTFLGIARQDKIFLNPDPNQIVSAEDKILVLSEDDDTIFLDGAPSGNDESLIVKGSHFASKTKRNILSIGFNDNTFPVIKEMFPFVTKGTKITFLTTESHQQQIPVEFRNQDLIEFQFIEGSTYDRSVLETIDYAPLDTVIVFANNPTDGERSDSETLLTVLNLKEIEKELHLNLSVIIEIEKYQNERIIQYASVDDFIISNVLSNKMLCQIAENRHLNQVFGELLGEEGAEIYLKRAEKYVKLHQDVDFYTVVQSALMKKEIAIGYRRKSIPENGGIIINPKKSELINFSEGDCIILLAED